MKTGLDPLLYSANISSFCFIFFSHLPFSILWISQLRKLEWVAISFSKRSSQPRDRTCVPCVVGGLYCWATAETIAAEWEINNSVQLVQFSRSVVSDSLRPHELQHARPPCPSPTPGVHLSLSPCYSECAPWSQNIGIIWKMISSFHYKCKTYRIIISILTRPLVREALL